MSALICQRLSPTVFEIFEANGNAVGTSYISTFDGDRASHYPF